MLGLLLSSLLLAAHAALAQDPRTDTTMLAHAGLVGDDGAVINSTDFSASVGTQVEFNDDGFEVDVVPGVLLTINQTAAQPTVSLQSSTDIRGKAYLVAMVDPDAPTPQNQSLAQVRHWVQANMIATSKNGNVYSLVADANTLAVGNYTGPAPSAPSDPHRYTLLVFQQPNATLTAPSGDDVAPFLKFDLATYVAGIEGLKLVGGTYFEVGPLGTVPNNGTYTPDVSGGNSTDRNGGGDNGNNGNNGDGDDQDGDAQCMCSCSCDVKTLTRTKNNGGRKKSGSKSGKSSGGM